MALGIVMSILLALAPVVSSHAIEEPDELMPGRSLTIKAAQIIRFVSKPTIGTFALPGAGHEPTTGGAELHVADVGPGFHEAVFSLPAAGWQALGAAGSPKGYRYRGTGSSSDPCKVVQIRRNVVKAVCRSTDGLSMPVSGEIGIRLEVAAVAKRYCASFGGMEVRNDSTAVKRKDAPPPPVCPFVTINTGTATSTSITTTSTSSSSVDPGICPTTTTLGAPSCGPAGPGQCGGICFQGQPCGFNASQVCECLGPALCGGYSHFCGGECPSGQTCEQRPVPDGCGSIGCECQ